MRSRAEFDHYEATYEQLVERSIGFSGRGHTFFVEAKAMRLLSLARRQLGPPQQLRALDVGCGPALSHGMIAPRFGSLSGVDVSEPLIERARREHPEVEYSVSEESRLPFADATFDVTFASCVLHHVARPAQRPLVEEMGRVTRPGGLVVIFEHNPWNPLTRLAVRRCPFDHDAVLLSAREGRALLRRAGLRRIASRHFLVFPFAHSWARQAERGLGRLPLGAQFAVFGEV